jgi:hypothetical protein
MSIQHFRRRNKAYRVNSSCLSSSEDFLMLVSTVGPFTYSYNNAAQNTNTGSLE